jgi:hypothetical protein
MKEIKGYDYGKSILAKSPVNMDDLALLKKTLLWSDEDDKYLKMAGEVLKDQLNEVLDLWYGYVGGNAHLVYYFSKNGQPNAEYLQSVRARFGQWILDLCLKPYDQDWLNYQYEIALRHHATKKNKTDQVDTAPLVHYRYMIAFIYPITVTIKPFLAKKGHSPSDVDMMHNSWFKAVVLTAILWTYPYVKPNEF